MNILFLTLAVIPSIESRSIYMDLMTCFAEHNHKVYMLCPLEKKHGQATYVEKNNNIELLHCLTGDLFDVGMIKKGISQSMLPYQYVREITKNWSNVKFDLLIYSTPPITLAGVVKKVKKKTGAGTYLLLKDIFPQNAIDIGILRAGGIKGFIYRHFKHQEKKLYLLSDNIGCMSQANVDYLLANNPYINREHVEICPNSIIPEESRRISELNSSDRKEMLEKLKIPTEKVIFLYGGNLGKPQDIPFVIECIKTAGETYSWAHFVICGSGTESGYVSNHAGECRSLTFIPGLPKQEYEKLVDFCDVGLVFLDHRFTIPNFPSRMLSYMDKSKPMLICADVNTDAGTIAQDNAFGVYCISDNTANFVESLRAFEDVSNRDKMGKNGKEFLLSNYTVEDSYRIIVKHYI